MLRPSPNHGILWLYNNDDDDDIFGGRQNILDVPATQRSMPSYLAVNILNSTMLSKNVVYECGLLTCFRCRLVITTDLLRGETL